MTVAEPYPDLVSLVVGRDVIPYNDLEIAPAYGRKILLPDDLPPVLSLGYSLGPTVPRAFRCQEDGALNVHVENQSSGGGLVKPTMQDWLPLTGVSRGLQNTYGRKIFGLPSLLMYRMTASFVMDPFDNITSYGGYVGIGVWDDDIGTDVTTLFSVWMAKIGGVWYPNRVVNLEMQCDTGFDLSLLNAAITTHNIGICWYITAEDNPNYLQGIVNYWFV